MKNLSAIFRQLHGIVPLAKPSGPSSAQCLNVFKRLGQKKIGHGGTLDPMASGVLLVLLGNATKLSGWLLQGGRKIYSGRIKLGVETDTWDTTGAVIAEKSCDKIGADAIESAIRAWTEAREQEVPPYSAAKYRGQPLYKLARKGHDTPVKLKSASIFEASLLEISMPFVSFRVACGSGSYIRSLAHSLGVRLGCGATLSELTREYSHPFALAQCHSLEEISESHLPGFALPLQAGLPDWPCVELEPGEALAVRNGRPVKARQAPVPHSFLCSGGNVLAIASLSEDGELWRVERGLWND